MVIAYKGFHKGLICMGYQFVMGKNVTEKANCRENGFHCAENPLDCLNYYPDIGNSEYCIVAAGGDLDEDGTDTKISCTELTILKRLTLKDFFLHVLVYMADHPKRKRGANVQMEKGEAAQGYAVVRGKSPRQKAKSGIFSRWQRKMRRLGTSCRLRSQRLMGKKFYLDGGMT